MASQWKVAAFALPWVIALPAEAREVHRFDIPAGSLQQSLFALGSKARVSIAFADPVLGKRNVPRLRGTMSVTQALETLLKGSGATYIAFGQSNYRIVSVAPRPPRLSPKRPAVRLPVATLAQPEPTEIVVTASKRSLSLPDYPGPVTRIDGERFAGGSAGSGTAAISEAIASLGSTHFGPGRDKLFVRGISDSSFSGQTQSTIGQYLGEARLTYNAPDPDLRLHDMASVELLPGPQGTLHGTGSLGGVLRTTPTPPDLGNWTAALTLSGASTAHGDPSQEIVAVLNLPLHLDGAALRMIGYSSNEGGYIDYSGRGSDNVNRIKVQGARVAALIELGGGWALETGAIVQEIDGKDSQYAEHSLPRLVRRSLFPEPFSNRYRLGYATLKGELGKAELTATVSASGHELSDQFDASKPELTPRLFQQENDLSLLSAEARLTCRCEHSGWLVGAHLLENSSRLERKEGPPENLEPLTGVANDRSEQTLFGEYSYRLASIVAATGGLRLTRVQVSGKAIDPAADPRRSADQDIKWRFLPSVALNLNPAAGSTLYLRYQQSFRPGGLVIRANETELLGSDRISSWEAGLRFGQGGQDRFAGAVAVSYSHWKDVQADTIDTLGFPTSANIGDGRIWSIDAEVRFHPTRELMLSGQGVWSRSRVTNSQPGIIIVDDAPLPNVPGVSARAAIDYSRPMAGLGELSLSAWARFVGKSWLGVGPILGRKQGDFLDTGFEARVGRKAAYLFARVTNLFDTAGNRFALGSMFGIVGESQVTPLRPTTVRLGFQKGF